MQKRRLRAPSPALVIAVIALFVALGGTTYAATSLPANSVGTAQIRNQAVTGAKLAHGVKLPVATHAITAQNATYAATARNADRLGKYPASYFALAAIEPAHVVGTTNQPPFENGWTSTLTAGDEGLSFYKDGWGIVHLQGNVANVTPTTGSTIFNLPTGYRPANDLYFSVYGSSGSVAFVQVTGGGDVNVVGPAESYVGLSNVSFRSGL